MRKHGQQQQKQLPGYNVTTGVANMAARYLGSLWHWSTATSQHAQKRARISGKIVSVSLSTPHRRSVCFAVGIRLQIVSSGIGRSYKLTVGTVCISSKA